MIVVPVKEGENIERALKKFKKKNLKKTGVVKELRRRQQFDNLRWSRGSLRNVRFTFRKCNV